MSTVDLANLGGSATGTSDGGDKRGLDVNISSADVALGGGTQYTEGDTDASITGTAMMMEGAGDALVAAQGTAADGLLVNLGSNNDVTTDISQTEDTAHNSGDKGVMFLTYRQAQANIDGTGADTNGDYQFVKSDELGRMYTNDYCSAAHDTPAANIYTQSTASEAKDFDGAALPNSVDTEGDLVRNAASFNGVQFMMLVNEDGSALGSIQGDVAHDSADSGNPLKVGFKAKSFDSTAPGTPVAEDDRVDSIADTYGRQYVNDMHPNFWHVSADYAAAQTNTSIKAAPGAGLKLYITDISISNGATAGNITLLDGSGGTVLFEHYPGINGGIVSNLRNPIALTANTALVITSTTVTTHSVNISGFIAP